VLKKRTMFRDNLAAKERHKRFCTCNPSEPPVFCKEPSRMRRFRLPIIIVLAVSFLLFLVLHCGDIATDPFSQEKANVSLHLISSDFVESDTAITDTIDKKMRLGVCLYLTQHIDSTVITIGKNITSLDTAFSCAYKDQQVDTVYYTFSFPAAGDRTVIATAYVGKSLRQTATATIHILARPVPNQKPELSVLGNRDIIAGQTCALEVTAIDPDVGQTAIIEASHLPAGAAFDGHSFSWSTTLADTGTHTAVFIATDNGTPPLLDSAAITITVTAPGVNRPPKWNEDTIIRGIEPGTHFSLTLADQCSDPDNDTLHFALLPGAPAGDTVLNGIYSFTPSANDTGVFFPRIAAFDPQNASDTMTVKLTITPLDNDTLPPIITRFDPVKDSTSTNANSYTVKVTCKDPSGVASVIYTLGEATFPAQKDAGDTIWSANVTDLVANTLNTITAIATDASLRANKDTLIISIKYDPTMTDSIGPMFYQKSGPATGSIVTDSIFSITDSIYDPSGIDSVYWTLNNNNSKPLTPVLRTTNKYSLTDTLRQFHLNTIMIYAVDKATSHNKSSQTVILNYIVPPKITTQPVSQSVCPQASATFSVTASGTRPFAYQWNKGGTTISTDSTFTIDAVTSPDTGTYTVTITNPADTITSLPAVLTVKTASSKPTITPASPTTCPGSPITLHLSGGMLGTGASWKWYTGSCGATLAGSDSTLTVNPSVNTVYYVRAEGGCQTTDCAFAQVTMNTIPQVTVQPVSQTVWVGDSVTFSISATGTAPLMYQWYRGTTAVGANSASLKIKPLAFADSGNYSCVVTNDCGKDTSEAGKLTVFYAKAAAASSDHSLFLRSDNTLWACGYNNNGQLGDNTTATRLSPVKIMSDVLSMEAGYGYSLIIKTDESLWACGANNLGQFGNGTTTGQTSPAEVMSGIKGVSAYDNFSLILKKDGTLLACGYNDNGQLGLGDNNERHTAEQVLLGISDISAGYKHSLILKSDTLWTCGNNWYGQLADGSTTFHSTPYQTITGVQDIAAGGYFSLILKSNGTLWGCGSNGTGQLGQVEELSTVLSPTEIISGVKKIAAGNEFSLILMTDGTLKACGVNQYGQLGDGTNINRFSPVLVTTNVQSIAAGGLHSFIIKTDGTLWAFGQNSSGVLGDGTTTDRFSPVQIKF
jgi:alpha-tubulin suppressor-like RCC1 family protein